MFTRPLRTIARFLPMIPLRTLFNTRPVFRVLPSPLFQPAAQSYPTIQARLMSSIPHESTQLRLDKTDKEWLNKSIEKFKIKYPNASTEDIANYKTFYLLQLKRLKLSDNEFDHNRAPDFNYTPDHRPDSLPAKVALLKMLDKPWEDIDEKLIAKTLKIIGFKVRKTIFQDTIELHLKVACDWHNPHEENLIFIKTSKMIEEAKTPDELVTAYAYLFAAPLTDRFKTSYEAYILNFMINAQMNRFSHRELLHNCTKHSGFASPVGHYLEKNRREFNQLKPYFVTMLTQLEAIKDELTVQPTTPFPEFIEKIKSTQNIAELMHELLKENTCLRFDYWEEVRSKVVDDHLFKDPSRLREQLYFLMKDADKRGIKFDFHSDETLIQDYIEYLQWNTQQMHKEADETGDERGGIYHYLTAQYGAYNPTDEDYLRATLREMNDALHNGRYQDKLSKMRKSIQHYRECTQPKINPKLG